MICYQSLPLKGLQVLVVDSDPDSRYLLTILFEEYGVETIAATSAIEALEILKQIKPDLLISEIRLPNEDGYSLMDKVKAFEMRKASRDSSARSDGLRQRGRSRPRSISRLWQALIQTFRHRRVNRNSGLPNSN